MHEYKITEDQRHILLIALGMALAACRQDEKLIKMVLSLVTIFAPDSDYALKDKK